MSGSGRKRSSKWDLGDGSEFAPDSKQLRSRWSSEDVAGSNNSKRPHIEGNDKLKPGLGREPFSGGRGSNKDDIMDKDYRGMDAEIEWEADASYSKKISPGFEEWQHQRHNQSPKNVRIRSGRSSRSRSPPHGFRLDSGVNDRNRMRGGGSTQICRDFSAGKCRRGSNCHFLHHDDHNYEDSWESKNREDGAPRYSDPHERRDHSHKSGRSNEACIHFAKGRCRMGASCKYVHHDISDGYGKSSVDELQRERDNDGRRKDNSFEQGGGHVPNRGGDTLCKFFANGNCRNGKYCRFSHDMQTCRSPNRRLRDEKWGSSPGGDHQTLDRPKLSDSFSPNGRLRTDRWGIDGSMSDADKAWDSPKQNDIVVVSDSAKLVEDKVGDMGATDPGLTVWPMRDAQDHSLDKSRVHGEPPFSSDKKEADHWLAENAGANMHTPQTVGIDIWPGDSKMSPDWNYRVGSSSHIEEEHGKIIAGLTQGSTQLATAEHDRVQVTPGQDLNQNLQNVNAWDSSRLHAVEQVQVAVPILPSKAGAIEGLQNQEVSSEKKYSVEPNIMDAGSSQISSRNPPMQDMVSKEQLAQLSNLSVSLAHILGSGQQLPQLYAALNPHNVKDPPSQAKTEVPTTMVSNTLVKPDPDVGFPKPYDPMCDSIELKEAVASGKQNCGDSSKDNNEVVAEERPNSLDGLKNTKENGPLENMDRNGGPDEAKKPKDIKGIRAFKFSLVEFVKELLKPTWKEGQITKEDYKTIVKKVVDKVTGTMQEGHIPQTQEKIDHYLSFSKPKLNKLVQAYVEKVQKPQ